MYERFYILFEKYEILYSMQFGFRANHSPVHALVSMTEKLKLTLDSTSFGCGIFVDLEKAFDTVNHSFKIDGALRCKRCSPSMVCLDIFQIENSLFQLMDITLLLRKSHVVFPRDQFLVLYYF